MEEKYPVTTGNISMQNLLCYKVRNISNNRSFSCGIIIQNRTYSPLRLSKDEQSRIIRFLWIAFSNTSKEVSPSFKIRTRIKLAYAG